jgi:hypothetical protein
MFRDKKIFDHVELAEGLTHIGVEQNIMMMTKPELTQERINEIQTLIANNPWMGRSEISRQICRIWEWQSPTGQLKDIAARDMLRALDKVGKITLPPPKGSVRKAGKRSHIKHLEHNMDPVECHLEDILPICLHTVTGAADLAEFKSLLDQFHYLGFDRTVGENIKYLAKDRYGRTLAILLFGSAAWSCGDRDHFIGWDKKQRSVNLMWMTNNVRFLIFPWIRIFNLASHVLALTARRISSDWKAKYGHGLVCLETFVDERFHGTAYKAANWIHVGKTLGRGRDGGHHYAIMPEKDIYLYPLDKDYREKLRGEWVSHDRIRQ